MKDVVFVGGPMDGQRQMLADGTRVHKVVRMPVMQTRYIFTEGDIEPLEIEQCRYEIQEVCAVPPTYIGVPDGWTRVDVFRTLVAHYARSHDPNS